MNNKAQFDVARKTVYWALGVFVITMIMIAFTFIIAAYKGNLTYVPEKLEANLIANRFINIPECFAYKDADSGRLYPGIIELNKFNNETLNECYQPEAEKGYIDYNFGLELKNKQSILRTNNYYHNDNFLIYREVLLKENDKFTTDTLIIHVQVKI